MRVTLSAIATFDLTILHNDYCNQSFFFCYHVGCCCFFLLLNLCCYWVLNKFLKTNADVFARFGSHEQIESLDIRARAQQFLYKNFSEESRCPRDEHAAISVELGDRRFLHFLTFCINYFLMKLSSI